MGWKHHPRLRTALACLGCALLGAVAGRRLAPRPAAAPPPAPAGAEAALGKVLPEVDLDDVPFDQAVDVAQRLAGVRIIVDRASPFSVYGGHVTFRARGVTFGQLLTEIVRPLRETGDSIAWAPDGNAILISTIGEVAKQTACVRAYDVRDLLAPGGAFDQGGPAAAGPAGEADALERLIENNVEPDSWRDAGGHTGSISGVGGRLLVVQTWEIQNQVARFLSDVKAAVLQAPAVPAPPSADLAVWEPALRRFVPAAPGAAEAALRRVLPEVRLEHVPLDDALVALSDLANVAGVADHHAMFAAATGADSPVTLHLHGVTLATALRAALNAAGGSALTFGPDEGSVLITPNPYRVRVTRLYDVRDWLAASLRDVPLPPPPRPAGGGSLFGSAPQSPAEQRLALLETAIEQSIESYSWKATSGTIGSIVPLNGFLAVTTGWETQEKVADFLAAVRCDPAKLKAALETPATAPAEGLQWMEHHVPR